MSEHGLEVAPLKTQAILLTKKWAYVEPKLYIAGHEISIQKSVKYLGVTLDQRLTFTPHVKRATKSAAEAARAIGRLLPNIGGPSLSKRLLLSTVVTANLMYASSIWADAAFKSARNRHMAGSTQCFIALRITRAHKTVSYDAALVLARTPQADLLAKERASIRQKLSLEPLVNVPHIKTEERKITMALWQDKWDAATKEVWTKRLIPDLHRWYNTSVTPNFQPTEFLTGHGCFQEYL